MRAILIFLMLSLLSSQLLALEESWGEGLIQCNSDSKFSIDVFDSPCGFPIGSLSFEVERAMRQPTGFVWREERGISMTLPEEVFLETGYEITSLIVHEERDSFVKILRTDMDQEFWISIEELSDSGFLYQPWIEFMAKSGRSFFTVNYGMNCREKPNAAGERLLTVKGDQFEIEPTGEVTGYWAEVIVREFNSAYCEEPHELIETYHGWMKILDDAGFPNVWFYTRGC
ncbi:MAG: hypothetical protein AB8F78_01740 [Saprospiraceae bacterium]